MRAGHGGRRWTSRPSAGGLEKDLAAARADIEAADRKLGNPSFVERAPAEVVAKNRARLAAARGRGPPG